MYCRVKPKRIVLNRSRPPRCAQDTIFTVLFGHIRIRRARLRAQLSLSLALFGGPHFCYKAVLGKHVVYCFLSRPATTYQTTSVHKSTLHAPRRILSFRFLKLGLSTSPWSFKCLRSLSSFTVSAAVLAFFASGRMTLEEDCAMELELLAALVASLGRWSGAALRSRTALLPSRYKWAPHTPQGFTSFLCSSGIVQRS